MHRCLGSGPDASENVCILYKTQPATTSSGLILVFQHICKISASLIARLQANTLTQKPPLHIQDSHVEVFHLIQQNPPRVIYIKLLSVSARKSKSEDPICVSPSRWLCCFLPGSIGSPGLFFWQGTKPNSFVSVKIASIKAVPKSGQ